MKSKKPKIDITGQRFGKLEVLRMEYSTRTKTKMWMAICKCHVCGREDYSVRPAVLKNGQKNTENCGCERQYIFRSQKGKRNKKFKGYEEIRASYVSSILRRAKKHNFDFELDAKFLWELFLKQGRKCALSGVDLFFDSSGNRKYEYFKKGNCSLDRIDSNGSYTKDNVQWVHKDVNLMKMYLDQEIFIEWCEKIIKNQNQNLG